MTLNKQSLIAALEALPNESWRDNAWIKRKEALSLAQQLDENVGVDERQEFEYKAISSKGKNGRGCERFFVYEMGDDGFTTSRMLCKCPTLATAEAIADKLNNSRSSQLTFLDDESVVEEVARRMCRDYYIRICAVAGTPCPETGLNVTVDYHWKEYVDYAKTAIRTIKRLAQSKQQ